MTNSQGNSELFKAAHQMTKSIIKAGDSYSATFGLCYKAVMAQEKAKPSIPVVEADKAYPSDKQHKTIFNAEPVMAYVAAILSFAFFLVFCSPVVAAAIGYFAGFTISAKSGALVMIEAFKLASAFGVASLILYAVYSFIGWGLPDCRDGLRKPEKFFKKALHHGYASSIVRPCLTNFQLKDVSHANRSHRQSNQPQR